MNDRDNLRQLLAIYKRWADELAPGVSFDDFLRRSYNVGKSNLLRAQLDADSEGILQFLSISKGGRHADDDDNFDVADDDDNNNDDNNNHNDDGGDRRDNENEETSAAPLRADELWAQLDERRPSIESSPPPTTTTTTTTTTTSAVDDEIVATMAQRERAERNRLAALEVRATSRNTIGLSLFFIVF